MDLTTSDEVILPSYVCRSVLDAVLEANARPVFADIDVTLHLSLASVEAVLTERTRCVIVPHLFGNIAPIDQIEAMLRARGVSLIDDAAQAIGAQRAGRAIGSFGDFGIVCGGPAKPLATPAGGLLLVDDPALHAAAMRIPLPQERPSEILKRTAAFWFWRRLRRYTILLQLIRDRLFDVGTDSTLDPHTLSNLDAALMMKQFERLRQNSEARRKNALLLLRILEPLHWTVLTDMGEDSIPLKLVLLLPEAGPDMDKVLSVLASAGIECQPGYRPCHLDHLGHGNNRLSVTESIWRRVVCLPIERPLSDSQRLCNAVSLLAGAGTPCT
jgi:dTDP-4-amino-4,6-dideoxygalactose transaminase